MGGRKWDKEGNRRKKNTTERIWIEHMYMNVCICNIQLEGNCLWEDREEEELGGGPEVLDRLE